MYTGSLVGGNGIEERHEGGAAEELSDEEGGVGLGLWALDGLKTMPQHALLATSFS